MSAVPQEAITAAAKAVGGSIGRGEPSETIATRALEAAAPFIVAAAYDQLGHDHYVIFTEDRWTIEHSVECRLSGHMHECDKHEAVARAAVEFAPPMAGRWLIGGIDSQGLPKLVRVT